MTYNIIKPFSPSIYKSKIDDKFLKILKSISDRTKEIQFDVAHTLAGNISGQYAAEFKEDDIGNFFTGINKHVIDYVNEFDFDRNNFFRNTTSSLDNVSINCNLGNGPWINYQYAGEFNPLHGHTGNISGVIYIDVPECIAEENNIVTCNRPSAGKIEFVSGSDGLDHRNTYSIQPSTGDILLFPAYLKHLVYPFTSNVERISIAFNIHNLQIL